MIEFGRVIEGEVWRPHERWSCPSCSRRVDSPADERVTGRMCGGDPRTGAPHPLADMVREVEQRAPRAAEVVTFGRRLVMSLDSVASMLGRDLPCPCGMVEVDNPVRREVRHRRGCEQGAGS